MKKYQNETLSFEERAKDLVAHMTVEECASQMRYSAPAIEHLGIKAYNWWNEALHGVARCGMATVFPQAIGMAASFDFELMEAVGDVIATEGRAKYNMYQKYEDYGIYKGITFWSPNVNIFRDPRWGRGQETYGEDPYLTSRMGISFVRGLQGDDPKYLKTAACAKHLAVHSGPEKIRHEFNAEATAKDMEETYLPAFKELVDCGVEGVMGAYNRLNAEPCCGSKTLLKDLLREKWGFQGYIVSDCGAIADFHKFHKVTADEVESATLAIENGCELNCGNVFEHIMTAYHRGKVSEKMIREAAIRLMTTRMKLGMFDKETPFDQIGMEEVDCPKHQQINEEMTRKTMVLLRNNGILPLKKETLKKIAVIGPNANSIVALEGNYHGTANHYITVLEGIRKEFANVRINFCEGSHLFEHKLEDPGYDGDRLAEAKAMTDEADLAILVVGMDETIEGEEMPGKELGGDKADLYLPMSQRKLIQAVCERNTPVVIVNLSGSAIDFEYGNDADAIIQAWYPGGLGGKVVAELLSGKYSPSGRLPVTFYRNDNILPAFTNYSMEGRTYKFIKEKPLFPFGYGLSYSQFSYDRLKLEKKELMNGESLYGSVWIKNTGEMEAEEVVQVYLKDLQASVRVPHHQLCDIHRVKLLPGEEKQVDFCVCAESFLIVREDGGKEYEVGEFCVFVGGSQPDTYSQNLMGRKVLSEKLLLR